MVQIIRSENNIITENRGIIQLLNPLVDIIVDVRQRILVRNY